MRSNKIEPNNNNNNAIIKIPFFIYLHADYIVYWPVTKTEQWAEQTNEIEMGAKVGTRKVDAEKQTITNHAS